MKTSRFFSILRLGAALCLTPAYAQRSGGSHGGGSRSSAPSHSGGSMGSSSRGGGFSGGSHSSAPSRSSYSGSSTSRSSMSGSHTPSNVPTRSNGSYNSPATRSYGNPSRSNMNNPRTPANLPSRSAAATPSRGSNGSRSAMEGTPSRGPRNSGTRTSAPGMSSPRGNGGSRGESPRVGGNPRGDNPGHMGNPRGPEHGPGHMPPSHRPMHPMFHHPIHHGFCHVHVVVWDPYIYHPWHWPGFWLYCHNYWYDYHCTNFTVVHEYMAQNYSTDLVAYAISGDYMYCLVNDPNGDTYLQVYDQNDKVLAEQKVNRKYRKMEIDKENGGCWILKKNDKDPMLFIYADGKLMIYEAE